MRCASRAERSCTTEKEVDLATQLMWQVAEAVVQGEDPYVARARMLKSTMETDDDNGGDNKDQGAAASSTVTTPPNFTKGDRGKPQEQFKQRLMGSHIPL